MITKIVSKCNNKIKFLYRNAKNLDKKNKMLLASALVQCHFDYGSSMWYTGTIHVKRHKISPWMTNGILKSINQRNRLYKNLKQFKPDSFIYTENNCISIDIGMSSRKQLLMPKDLTIKIFLSNTNLT